MNLNLNLLQLEPVFFRLGSPSNRIANWEIDTAAMCATMEDCRAVITTRTTMHGAAGDDSVRSVSYLGFPNSRIISTMILSIVA